MFLESFSTASTRAPSTAPDTLIGALSPEFKGRAPTFQPDLGFSSEQETCAGSQSDDDDDDGEDEFVGEPQDVTLPRMERISRLERLMTSVHELQAIDKDIDGLISRVFGVGPSDPDAFGPSYSREQLLSYHVTLQKVIDQPSRIKPKAEKIAAPVCAVPPGWQKKESTKYPGRYYYVNSQTGATTWKLAPAEPQLLPPPIGPPPGLSLIR